MSLRCLFGFHADAIRDRARDGTQVLGCSECWRVRAYPVTDVSALRAEQQRQRAAIQAQRQHVKAQWRAQVEG